MFYKIYLENNHLVIESFLLKEKISLYTIDDIIILHDTGWNKHRVFMYFIHPVQYEMIKHTIFHQFLFGFFKLFNSNSYSILRSYEDELITTMFSLLKVDLPGIKETKDLDLDHSFTWRTVDEGTHFKKMKLVYSKSGFGLKRVLLKHKILK